MLLNEVIKEIKDTFHSIDIRVFSHKQNDVWNSIFTVIRFRRETEDELQQIQKDLIKKCGSLIETEKFKVGIFHYPVEKWATLINAVCVSTFGFFNLPSLSNLLSSVEISLKYLEYSSKLFHVCLLNRSKLPSSNSM